MKRLSAVVLSLVVVTTAHAQDVGVRIAGVGTLSCGEYIELRETNNPAQNGVMVSWVWGYMGGFNMESRYPTTARTPDQPSTLSYIDKHCRDNPLDNVMHATWALIKALGGRRNPR